MDLDGIVLSGVPQTEKDKSCMIPLTSGIYRKKLTETNSEIEQFDWQPDGRGSFGGGVKKGKGLSRTNR